MLNFLSQKNTVKFACEKIKVHALLFLLEESIDSMACTSHSRSLGNAMTSLSAQYHRGRSNIRRGGPFHHILVNLMFHFSLKRELFKSHQKTLSYVHIRSSCRDMQKKKLRKESNNFKPNFRCTFDKNQIFLSRKRCCDTTRAAARRVGRLIILFRIS